MKIVKIDGTKLKKQRKLYGLTLSELSDNINISIQQINSIEKGRSDTSDITLNKIVKFFNKPRVRGGFRVKAIREVNKAYFLI